MINRLTHLDPEPPWSIMAALGVMAAMFITLVAGVTLAQVALADTSTSLVTIAGWSVGLTFTAVLVLNLRRRTAEEADALRIDSANAPLLALALVGLGAAGTLDLLSWVVMGEKTGAGSELIALSESVPGAAGWAMALIFMVGIQPVAEEVVFRGMLFPSLRVSLGAWTGLILCGGFYATFHVLAYVPEGVSQPVFIWYGVTLPFLDGLILGGVRAYTGSTRAAMVAHGAFGLFAIFKLALM